MAVHPIVGVIADGSTWFAGETYLLTGDATLEAGTTLTIQPGAIVQFAAGFGADLTIAGSLNATGTAANHILFTSDRDGSSTPARGDWETIRFTSTSSASNLAFWDVRYGGGNGPASVLVESPIIFDNSTITQSATAGMKVSSVNPQLSNAVFGSNTGAGLILEVSSAALTGLTFQDNGTAGLRLVGSNPSVTGGTWTNNTGPAISMDLVSAPTIPGGTFTGNAMNGVRLDSGTLAGSASWNNPAVVYEIAGEVIVPAGATLTVGAGQIVKFNGPFGARLTVDGTLNADGTASQRIIFTSSRDDSAGGDTNSDGTGTAAVNGEWPGITLASGSTGNVLDNVEIRFGGGGSNGAALFANAPFTLSNSAVKNSSVTGVRIESGTPTITGNTFDANSQFALSVALAADPALSGNTFTNNGVNGLRLDGGTLAADTAWNDPDVVFYLASSLTVPAGKTLTISPGQIVKLTDSTLTIEGTLLANGTAQAPIIFTSPLDDSAGGDTNNNGASSGTDFSTRTLIFSSTSTGSSLSHVEARFFNGATGGIEMNGVAVPITDSVITGSLVAGLSLLDSSPTLTRVTIANSNGAAIAANLTSNPVVVATTLTNNSINGLSFASGIISADTTWNSTAIVYVTNGLTVAQGTTFTLGPGVVVKPRSGNPQFQVDGTLRVTGTGAQRVIITSLADDTAGGDTNNSPTAPSAGDWTGIVLTPTSIANLIDDAELRYGGSSGEAMLTVNTAPLTLRDSVLRNSASNGLVINTANPTITNNSFQNNLQAAIRMDLASNPAFGAQTFAGNFVNGVELPGGVLPGDTTWSDPGVVYWISNDITVPAGVKLTVGAQQIVKFADGRNLLVEGTLDARGGATTPVIFTSDSDDAAGGRTYTSVFNGAEAAAGEWGHIKFTATSTANVLDRVEIRYGGGTGGVGMVTVVDAPLSLTNSILRDTLRPLLRIEQATPTISNNVLRGAFDVAISMDLVSDPVFSGNQLFGNLRDHLSLDGGTLPAGTTTWDWDIIYDLPSRITVPVGATLVIAPGQIFKAPGFVPVVEDALVVNGTLTAIGTNERPIIFTTYFDDVGGRSAGHDRNAAQVAQFLWEGLIFNSTSTGSVLDHVEVRNAGYRFGNGQPVAGVTVDGAPLTIRDSALLSATGRSLLALNGANVTMTNTIVTKTQPHSTFGLRAESGATLTLTNNTIANVFSGIEVDNATATLKNNFLGLQMGTAVAVSNGGVVTASFNNIFQAGQAWSGMADQTGINGNRAVDPLFVNVATSDYRLKAGSPMIDAGTSNGAPTNDRIGAPRYDDPAVENLGAGAQPFVDIGAFERQSLTSSAIDLTTTSVNFNLPSGVPTGLPRDSVTVSWTVQNIGPGGALGPWTDAIYLSPDPVWSPDDVLLGEQVRNAFLGPGSSYSASKSVLLPSVLPGEYYFIVRANSGNDVFEGQTLANNPGPSATTIEMDLPSLVLGAPFTTNLVADGDAKYFKVTLPAGKDLSVTLDGPSGVVNELYVRYGALPSRQLFDERGVRNGPDQSVSFANTSVGDYYVLIYGNAVPQEENVELTASLIGFSIGNVEPRIVGSGGNVTFTISGAQFDSTSVPKLRLAGGALLDPQRVYFSDSGLLAATFAVPPSAVGTAEVQVFNGAALTTYAEPITIVSGGSAQIQTNIVVPQRLRLDRDYTITLQYTNTGLIDAPAPIFQVTSTKDLLSVSPDRSDGRLVLDLIGLGPNYPGGIIPPGATVTLPIYSHSGTSTGVNEIGSSVAGAYTGPLDWDAIGPVIRPDGISNAEWDPLLAKLRQRFGETWESFREVITEDASLYPAGRGNGVLLDEVFALEVERAVADLRTSVSGRIFLRDATHPAGNVELRLYDAGTGKTFETVSLNDGTFTFPIVEPGNYDVLFSGFIAVGAPQVTVSASDVASDFTITPGGVISGSVLLTPRGVPLREVIVSASNADGQHFFTVTDNLGRFRIDSLPSGDYTLNAGGDTFSQATLSVEDLVAGSERAQVNFTVKQGGSISGFVKGPGNLPIANATVSAIGADGQGYTATSDETGAFTIASLAPQTYDIIASGAGFVRGVLDNVVLGDAPLSNVDLALTHGGSITGTITKTGGAPAPFEFVQLELGGLLFSAQADSEGVYSLSNLPAGTYTLTVPGTDTMTVTSTEVVVAEATTAAATITLPPLGTISGLVTNTTTSAPLGGVTVFVLGPDGVLASDVTGSDGRYSLTGIDAGNYSVVLGDVDTAGVARAAFTLSPATPIATQNFTTAVSGIVSGTIFQADGTTPAAGAIVSLAQAGAVILSRTADANGNYSFVVLSSGSYEVVAVADGLTYALANVSVSGGATTDADFIPGTRTISGTVRDASNTIVPGATVVIYREGTEAVSAMVSFLTADANGAFSVTGLADGAYRIDAFADGLAMESAVVTIAGANPALVSFSLDVEGTLTGVITDAATSDVLAGADIFIVSRTAQQRTFPATTDVTGAFSAAHLLPGTYDVIVMKDGHRTSLGSVVIATGDNTFDVALDAPTTTLTGQVADAGGALPGVTVRALDANGLVLGEAETGANGAFSITALPAGSYSLVVVAEGFAPTAAQPVTLTNGQTSSGHNFTLQAAALSDPEDNAIPAPPEMSPEALGPEAIGLPGWLTAVLQTPQRDGNQPTAVDIVGLIDLANCRDASQRTLTAVRQAEMFFRNWEYVAEGSITNLLREGTSSFLQFTVAAGKILSVLNPELIATQLADLDNLKLAGELIAGVKVALNNFAPIIADYIAYYTTFKDNFDVQTGDSVALQGAVADAGVKIATLKTGILEARDKLAVASGKLAEGASSGPTKAYKLLGRIFGIFDAGFATASAISDAVLGLQSVVGQVVAIQNAEKVYHNSVDNAHAAISALVACKAEHDEENPDKVPEVDPFGKAKKRPRGGNPPPPPPPDAAPDVFENPTHSTLQTNSNDPNDKHGPAGFGAGNFIQRGLMAYEVEFENIPTAGANAQIVIVTDQLDSDLDLDTFEFGEFAFGRFTFQVPDGLSHYETVIDLRPDGIELLVPVTLDLNKTTGLITVRFESLNPDSALAPDGVDEGFLPPNNANHDGEGHFTYTVSPKSTAGSGTVITNQASIIFDTNAPILTPTTLHTLDIDAPTSAVVGGAATVNKAKFDVTWSGGDGPGSGVGSYDVFVSDNNGPYTLFLSDTTATSAPFVGQNGHTYRFYTVATDNVGFTENIPLTADATVSVELDIVTIDKRTPLKFTDANGDIVTVKLSGNGTAQATLERAPGSASTVPGNLDSLILAGTDAKTNLTISVKKAGAGDGKTPLAQLLTTTAKQSLKGINASAVVFGSGAADANTDLLISGSVGAIKLGDVAANSILEIGTGYTTGTDQATIAALKPALTFGAIAGANVSIEVNGGVKSFTAASWAFDGMLGVAGALGSVTLKGSLRSDIMADTIGNVTVTLAKQTGNVQAIDGTMLTAKSIGNITAKIVGTPTLASATAIRDSIFTATTGTIGNVTASITSGQGNANLVGIEGSLIYAGSKIGKVGASAKISAGNATGMITAMADTDILAGQQQTIAVVKDLATAGIAGVKLTGSMLNSRIAAKGSLGTVSITGDMFDSLLLAGVNAGADRELQTADDSYHYHASIAGLTVGKAFARSSVIAGIDPGDDQTWGGGAGADTDTLGAQIGALTVLGKLGKVTLGAATAGTTPFGSPAALSHLDAISAPGITSVKIGKITQKTFTPRLWIDSNGNTTEEASEVLIRVITPT